jgi:hypothetical protein
VSLNPVQPHAQAQAHSASHQNMHGAPTDAQARSGHRRMSNGMATAAIARLRADLAVLDDTCTRRGAGSRPRHPEAPTWTADRSCRDEAQQAPSVKLRQRI